MVGGASPKAALGTHADTPFLRILSSPHTQNYNEPEKCLAANFTPQQLQDADVAFTEYYVKGAQIFDLPDEDEYENDAVEFILSNHVFGFSQRFGAGDETESDLLTMGSGVRNRRRAFTVSNSDSCLFFLHDDYNVVYAVGNNQLTPSFRVRGRSVFREEFIPILIPSESARARGFDDGITLEGEMNEFLQQFDNGHDGLAALDTRLSRLCDTFGVGVAKCANCKSRATLVNTRRFDSLKFGDDDSDCMMCGACVQNEEHISIKEYRRKKRLDLEKDGYISNHGEEAWDAREASRLEAQRKQYAEKRANMSEEELEKVRDNRHKQYTEKRANMSEEELEKVRDNRHKQYAEKRANMSEEELEKVRDNRHKQYAEKRANMSEEELEKVRDDGRKYDAAKKASMSEEELEKDRDYHRKYDAARYVRDKARKKAKLDEAAEKGSREAEKIEEGNQPAPANDDLDDLSLTQKTTLAPKPAKEKAKKKAKKKATKNPNWKADETILHCKLKRVIGTQQRPFSVWNKLDGHARETMNIENFPSHATFGKWWEGLNNRTSPLTSIAIEVIESFCKVA